MRELDPVFKPDNEEFAVVASRFNDVIVARLIDGAARCFRERGVDEDHLIVYRVPGALEIGAAVSALVASGRVAGVVALGAVIRGETAHFDVVVSSSAKDLAEISRDATCPVGNGVLTVDSLEQAFDRAGGKVGNKGYEATESMLKMVAILREIKGS